MINPEFKDNNEDRLYNSGYFKKDPMIDIQLLGNLAPMLLPLPFSKLVIKNDPAD